MPHRADMRGTGADCRSAMRSKSPARLRRHRLRSALMPSHSHQQHHDQAERRPSESEIQHHREGDVPCRPPQISRMARRADAWYGYPIVRDHRSHQPSCKCRMSRDILSYSKNERPHLSSGTTSAKPGRIQNFLKLSDRRVMAPACHRRPLWATPTLPLPTDIIAHVRQNCGR